MRYTIWIVSPYSHSQCFVEVAHSLQAAFLHLGHECEITTDHPAKSNIKDNVIVLGGHLAHPDDMLYLEKPIVWQLEQIPGETEADRQRSSWITNYLEVLRRAHEVWDYSRKNIVELESHGIKAKILEVGYMPILTRIENTPTPDIDVLHIGSMSQRRAHILQGLQSSGVKVLHAFDYYGVKRDALIARAKIVINIHHYESKLWEIVRCSYLLANRKCVVSETGLDTGLEKPYYGAVAFTSYEGLIGECLGILEDDSLRQRWETSGFDRFRKFSQVEYLRRVLQ